MNKCFWLLDVCALKFSYPKWWHQNVGTLGNLKGVINTWLKSPRFCLWELIWRSLSLRKQDLNRSRFFGKSISSVYKLSCLQCCTEMALVDWLRNQSKARFRVLPPQRHVWLIAHHITTFQFVFTYKTEIRLCPLRPFRRLMPSQHQLYLALLLLDPYPQSQWTSAIEAQITLVRTGEWPFCL